MTVLSIEFAFSFLCFLCVYWGLARYPVVQKGLLLIVGFTFIACASPYYLLISISLSLLVFGLSRLDTALWFKVTLTVTPLPLIVFKYHVWALDLVQQLFQWMDIQVALPQIAWVVPLGISFYTFNLVSYVVSMHRKELLLSPHLLEELLDTLLFTHFLPVIVSGPILRAKDMWPQWRTKQRSIGEPSLIFMLILMGLFKKLLLASYLNGSWMAQVFQNPMQYNTLELLAGIYAYAFEIYCDFSGYSDLAMAMGLLLGFDVPRNFKAPYISANLKEFWTRWHISLSLWIRDYIYIPLGGSRGGFIKTQLWVFIAMVLSGIWHGSGTTFLVWGVLHAMGVVVVNVYHRFLGRTLPKILSQLITFHYVVLTWVYFRSQTIEQAHEFLISTISNISIPWTQPVLYPLLALVGVYITQHFWVSVPDNLYNMLKRQTVWKQAVLFTITLWLIITLSPSGIPNFIYAQF